MAHISSRKRTSMLRFIAVGTATIAALALGGCSASTDSAGESSSEVAAAAAAADPQAPESTTITAAIWQSGISAQWFLGGEYAEENYGLTFKSDWMTDATVGRAQLASGSIDIVPGSPFGAGQLSVGGADTLIVAGNYVLQKGQQAIYARAGSGIESVLDLQGKTVAFSSITGADPNRLRIAIKDAGGDPESVKLVSSTLTDIPGQLANASIDAADVGSLIIPTIEKAGGYEVLDLGSGEWEGRPYNVWLTTKSYYLAHPNTIAAFQCSMEAGSEAGNDPATFTAFLSNTLGWNADRVAAQIPIDFVTGPVDPADAQADWDDAVAANGDPEYDVASLVIPWPKDCAA